MRPMNGATPLAVLEAVAIDTETTALDARKARIVQLGAVRIAAGRVTSDTFSTLVNPGQPVPPSATAIHGITDQQLSGAPDFASAWRAMSAFCGERVLIGHSIGYDLTVLEREAHLAGLDWRRPRSLCVRLLGAVAQPRLPDHSLETLAAWLGVNIEGRHSAVGDAMAAADIFLAMIPRLAERGIRTLAEAERASLARRVDLEALHQAGWIEPVRRPESAPVLGRVDPYAYIHRIRDVMSSPPVILSSEANVETAISTMSQRRISSVFVSDDGHAGAPTSAYGVVTERDVMRGLAAEGPAVLERKLGGIASRPLASVAGEAFLYRAVARMSRLGIRHLAVRDEAGLLAGVISARDLLRLRASAAIDLEDEIDAAESAGQLSAAWARLPEVAGRLIAEDVDAATVSAIVSEELRVVTRRAAILAERAMLEDGRGEPPCPYAMMVLGSGGRGESLLAADQDNALVFAEGKPDGPQDRWFGEFGARIADLLDTAGIPYCKGGVMAREPAWRGSRETWRARVLDWVRRSSPDDLLNVDIFFDQRAVHGETALARELFDFSYEAGREQRHFPVLLGERMAMAGTAFTLFGNLRTRDGRIDLKAHGLFPLVSCARALAVRHDLRHRGTRSRLSALADKGIGSQDEIRALLEAHSFILSLMLAQQGRDMAEGISASNRVEIAGLGRTRLGRLKRALTAIEQLPDFMRSLMGR